MPLERAQPELLVLRVLLALPAQPVPKVQLAFREPLALLDPREILAILDQQVSKGPQDLQDLRVLQVLQVRAQQVPRVHRAQRAQTALRAV